MGLHTDLFVESSPSPSKYCLAKMGMLGENLRLPLVPTAPEHHAKLDAAMRQAGVEL